MEKQIKHTVGLGDNTEAWTWQRRCEKPIMNIREPTRLRVAIFVGAYDHITDGVTVVIKQLVSYLRISGVEVRVIAPSVNSNRKKKSEIVLPTVSVPAPGRPGYRLSLRLGPQSQSELRRFNPHIVHIATPDFIGFWASLWAKRTGRLAVGSFHTHFSSYLRCYHFYFAEPVAWAWMRSIYNRCRKVFVTSPAMLELLPKHRIKDLALWRRGVDTIQFTPSKRSEQWRNTLGFSPSDVVICYVGRIVKEKNLELFARVIRNLEFSGVSHRSLIVGEGPMRRKMEAALPQTQFTGLLSGENLAVAYASSDIFFFPSETETFGLVVLEALASGLAVISANSGGSRSMIKHGENGFLVDGQEEAKMTEYIVRLIRDARLRDRIRMRARASVQRLDRSHIEQERQMLESYRLLLSGFDVI
jgi:glycosyltransferase involved in cell wall biosynthesis